MNKQIIKRVELYKINFFQPKTNKDQNEAKESLIITRDWFNRIKEDLKNNRRIEINWELFNPYTIDTVKKFKVDESVDMLLKQQNESVQEKVKWYMRYEKKNTDLQRLEAMIEKAREELNIK